MAIAEDRNNDAPDNSEVQKQIAANTEPIEKK